MSDALQSLSGVAGFIVWIAVFVAIVAVVELMRYLAIHDSFGLRFPQIALIVAASVVVLVIAGGGGFLLMRVA